MYIILTKIKGMRINFKLNGKWEKEQDTVWFTTLYEGFIYNISALLFIIILDLWRWQKSLLYWTTIY